MQIGQPAVAVVTLMVLVFLLRSVSALWVDMQNIRHTEAPHAGDRVDPLKVNTRLQWLVSGS
jgi:hypothetical protein